MILSAKNFGGHRQGPKDLTFFVYSGNLLCWPLEAGANSGGPIGTGTGWELWAWRR